jgi:hypothetical protein
MYLLGYRREDAADSRTDSRPDRRSRTALDGRGKSPDSDSVATARQHLHARSDDLTDGPAPRAADGGTPTPGTEGEDYMGYVVHRSLLPVLQSQVRRAQTRPIDA